MPSGMLRISRDAVPEASALIRHSVKTFLAALEIPNDVSLDVTIALGEAVANVVEHAYEEPGGDVAVSVKVGTGGLLTLVVSDNGTFVPPRPRAGRGFGLQMIRTVSKAVTIESSKGTRVTTQFRLPRD